MAPITGTAQDQANRQCALAHAMHLADIVATHNDRAVDDAYVTDVAERFRKFLVGEGN